MMNKHRLQSWCKSILKVSKLRILKKTKQQEVSVMSSPDPVSYNMKKLNIIHGDEE